MVYPLAHLRPVTKEFSPERRVVIFSDFDGTVSAVDSLKILLNRFADSRWPEIERAMSAGEMPESLGLRESFGSLQLSFEVALRYVLDKVKLDPSFETFANWVQAEGHELSILSGGFENFIRPLLRREGLHGLKLLANKVSVRSGSWTVTSCPTEKICPKCTHCKSASLLNEIKENPDTYLVYVGDGLTDTCAIQLADLVFAKGFLKTYCDEKGISCVAFSSFEEVTNHLQFRFRKLAHVA